jgi:hypothetical protein
MATEIDQKGITPQQLGFLYKEVKCPENHSEKTRT